MRAVVVLLLVASTLALTPASAEVVWCRDVADELPWGHPVNPRETARMACEPVDDGIQAGLGIAQEIIGCLLPFDPWAPCSIYPGANPGAVAPVVTLLP